MSDNIDRAERRKQNRLHKLGTRHPICPLCGQSDWRCFELHHIAGRKYDPQEMPLCMNCHAKCSDLQNDHPAKAGPIPSLFEIVGRYLLGLADMLEMVVTKLKEFGRLLLDQAKAGTLCSEGIAI
jgi:hypothetical protein